MTLTKKKPLGVRLRRRLQIEGQVWLLCIPMIVWVVIFCYLPIYGIVTAFLQYTPGKPLLGSAWVGLKFFKEFFQNPTKR